MDNAPNVAQFTAPAPGAPPTADVAPADPREPDRSSLVGACQIEDKEERGKAIVAVMERWETAVRHLWPAWHEAGGMTYGDQHGEYNAQLGAWQERKPAPARKVTRIDLNHMEPICSDVASLQCQDPPNMRATAPTDATASQSAAVAADQLVWWMWETEDYDEINLQIREAAAVYGTVYVFPRWDPTAGRRVEQVTGYEEEPGPPDPLTGLPTSMGLREVREMVPEGAFDDAIVSCFAGVPDPNSKAMWDGEGFGIHERMSMARAAELYPEHAEHFQPTGSASGHEGQYYENRMHNASPRTGGLNAKDDHAKRELDAWTVFLRSCGPFYRGKWLVIIGNRIVYEEDNPVYPTEEEEKKGEGFPTYHWPVFKFRHKRVAGSFFGQGIAIRMIGPQKKLNFAASKKLHMLKRDAHPTLVSPKGANFVKTDEPDQHVQIGKDIPPGSIYYLSYPGIPQDIQLEERLSVEQMERIAGLHAGSRGESESGDSGTKTRQLFQRDLGRLANIKYLADKQLGRVFAYKLRLWRRHATVARTIQVVGENHATQAKSFDMASIAAGTDILVFQDAGLPRDPAARMLHIEKAVQLKIVDPTDPTQRAGLAELIGLAGSLPGWQSSLIIDRKCAADEDIRMYDGETCTVEFWHDDLQHLAKHFTEMNSEGWRRATEPLPNDPPQVVQEKLRLRLRFVGHVQTHQLQIQKKKAGIATVQGPGPAGSAPLPAPGGAAPGPMPAGPGPAAMPSIPPQAGAGPAPQGMAA